jgi:hypothetical protein
MTKSTEVEKSVSKCKHIIVGTAEHRRAKMIAAETGGQVSELVCRLINVEYDRYRSKKNEKAK